MHGLHSYPLHSDRAWQTHEPDQKPNMASCGARMWLHLKALIIPIRSWQGRTIRNKINKVLGRSAQSWKVLYTIVVPTFTWLAPISHIRREGSFIFGHHFNVFVPLCPHDIECAAVSKLPFAIPCSMQNSHIIMHRVELLTAFRLWYTWWLFCPVYKPSPMGSINAVICTSHANYH